MKGSFILRSGCIAVGISYCADNGHYKVFESHARDIYGKSHPQGTCTIRYNFYHLQTRCKCITFKVYMEQVIFFN